MGPYSYFGEIFIWAWFNVPHFAVFRAASRWIIIAALAHAYFVSNLISLLSGYLSENKSSIISHNSQTRKNKEIEKKHSFKSSNLLFGSTSLNVKKIRNFFRAMSIFLILIVFCFRIYFMRLSFWQWTTSFQPSKKLCRPLPLGF